MLIALNEENKLSFADKKLSKKERYYCPTCKERVYLKTGKIMRPHFAHYQKKNCQTFTEGETEEHLTGKLDLAAYFKKLNYKVKLEAYLNQLQQRPDLLIEKDKKKIAVEFQCSSISIKQIEERTEGYLSAGYQVIWILGRFFTYRQKLTNIQKASLYYSSYCDNYLLFTYEVMNQQLIIHHNFQIDTHGKMHCTREGLSIGHLPNAKLNFKKRLVKYDHYPPSITQQHYQLTKDTYFASTKTLEFLSLIYKKQENIVSIPVEIYQRMPNEWMIQTYHMAWKHHLLNWIESHGIREIITKNSLKFWLKEKNDKKEILFSSIPTLNKRLPLTPFFEFLDYLAIVGVVKKVGQRKWSYQRPAKRFQCLEDKLL